MSLLPEKSPTSMRILLIEDDEDDYVFLRDLLQEIPSLKYDLEWISRFDAALKEMAAGRHDLYLLDYRLGPKTGLELAQKATAAGCSGPILFLTGHEDYETDIEVMKAGAADYLVKGHIDSPLLERSIRYALERKRTEAALQAERNKLKSIYEAMPEGILVLNHSFQIEYVNPLMEKNFGPLRGRKCYEYLYDRTEACPHCHDQEIYKGNTVCGETFIEKIGKTYDIVYTPLHNVDGTISKLEIFHDITERKQAEQQVKESADQLRQLSNRILSAHEEERKKIAGDIHDIIGSSLAAIKYKIENTLTSTRGIPKEVTESFQAVIPMVQEGIEECRRLQLALRPPMLDDLGLQPTLSWFFRRFQTIYTGIKVELDHTLEETDVPGPLKIVLFRIIQEAMNNVAKHSQADQVHVSLRKQGSRLDFVLKDNGQGFNPAKVFSRENRQKGLGVSSMRERVELSGGSFVIKSQEGKGTLIQASWPCD